MSAVPLDAVPATPTPTKSRKSLFKAKLPVRNSGGASSLAAAAAVDDSAENFKRKIGYLGTAPEEVIRDSLGEPIANMIDGPEFGTTADKLLADTNIMENLMKLLEDVEAVEQPPPAATAPLPQPPPTEDLLLTPRREEMAPSQEDEHLKEERQKQQEGGQNQQHMSGNESSAQIQQPATDSPPLPNPPPSITIPLKEASPDKPVSSPVGRLACPSSLALSSTPTATGSKKPPHVRNLSEIKSERKKTRRQSRESVRRRQSAIAEAIESAAAASSPLSAANTSLVDSSRLTIADVTQQGGEEAASLDSTPTTVVLQECPSSPHLDNTTQPLEIVLGSSITSMGSPASSVSTSSSSRRRVRASPDFKHVIEAKNRLKAKKKEFVKVVASKFNTRASAASAKAAKWDTFGSLAQSLIDQQSGQEEFVAAPPTDIGVQVASGGRSQCALKAMAAMVKTHRSLESMAIPSGPAQMDLSAVSSAMEESQNQQQQKILTQDMEYVCIDSETGVSIPWDNIQIVEGPLPTANVLDLKQYPNLVPGSIDLNDGGTVAAVVDSSGFIVSTNGEYLIMGESEALVTTEPTAATAASVPATASVETNSSSDNNPIDPPQIMMPVASISTAPPEAEKSDEKSPQKETESSPPAANSQICSPRKRHVFAAVTPQKFMGSPMRFTRTPIKTPLRFTANPAVTTSASVQKDLGTPAAAKGNPPPDENSLDTPLVPSVANFLPSSSWAKNNAIEVENPRVSALHGTPAKVGNETPEYFTPSPSPMKGKCRALKEDGGGTPGLKILAEEAERFSDPPSEDSMSPSRFQKRREESMLRHKVLRKQRGERSRKNIGLAIERSLNAAISPDKKGSGQTLGSPATDPPSSSPSLNLALSGISSDRFSSPVKSVSPVKSFASSVRSLRIVTSEGEEEFTNDEEDPKTPISQGPGPSTPNKKLLLPKISDTEDTSPKRASPDSKSAAGDDSVFKTPSPKRRWLRKSETPSPPPPPQRSVRVTNLKSSMEPEKPMFSSPVKLVKGTYIVSGPSKQASLEAAKEEDKSEESHISPPVTPEKVRPVAGGETEHPSSGSCGGPKKTPVKLLLVAKSPSKNNPSPTATAPRTEVAKVGADRGTTARVSRRRAVLVRVQKSSPGKLMDGLSGFEFKHNINNLDNYTTRKDPEWYNKTPCKTPKKKRTPATPGSHDENSLPGNILKSSKKKGASLSTESSKTGKTSTESGSKGAKKSPRKSRSPSKSLFSNGSNFVIDRTKKQVGGESINDARGKNYRKRDESGKQSTSTMSRCRRNSCPAPKKPQGEKEENKASSKARPKHKSGSSQSPRKKDTKERSGKPSSPSKKKSSSSSTKSGKKLEDKQIDVNRELVPQLSGNKEVKKTGNGAGVSRDGGVQGIPPTDDGMDNSNSMDIRSALGLMPRPRQQDEKSPAQDQNAGKVTVAKSTGAVSAPQSAEGRRRRSSGSTSMDDAPTKKDRAISNRDRDSDPLKNLRRSLENVSKKDNLPITKREEQQPSHDDDEEEEEYLADLDFVIFDSQKAPTHTYASDEVMVRGSVIKFVSRKHFTVKPSHAGKRGTTTSSAETRGRKRKRRDEDEPEEKGSKGRGKKSRHHSKEDAKKDEASKSKSNRKHSRHKN